MNSLLSLYNPYYNMNVIELHLELLKENGIVAFGKVRSPLRDYEHPNQVALEVIYNETTKETPTQLLRQNISDYQGKGYILNDFEEYLLAKAKQDAKEIAIKKLE